MLTLLSHWNRLRRTCDSQQVVLLSKESHRLRCPSAKIRVLAPPLRFSSRNAWKDSRDRFVESCSLNCTFWSFQAFSRSFRLFACWSLILPFLKPNRNKSGSGSRQHSNGLFRRTASLRWDLSPGSIHDARSVLRNPNRPWWRQRWVAYRYFHRRAPCQTEACKRLLLLTKRRTFRSKRHLGLLGRRSYLYRTFRKDFHRWCALRYQSQLVLQIHRPGSGRKCCLAKCHRGHSPRNEGN